MKITFSRGFISLSLVLIIVVGLVIVGGTGYYLTQSATPSTEVLEENLSTTTAADPIDSPAPIATTDDSVSSPSEVKRTAPAIRPTCVLRATPSTVFPLEAITFTWESTDANTASLNEGQGAILGGLSANGHTTVKAHVPAVITPSLTVSGPHGSATCSTKITVSQQAGVVQTAVGPVVPGLFSTGEKPPSGFLVPSSASIPSGFIEFAHAYESDTYGIQYNDFNDLNANGNPASLSVSGKMESSNSNYASKYAYYQKLSESRNQAMKGFAYGNMQGAVFDSTSYPGNTGYQLILKDGDRLLEISARDGSKTHFSLDQLISILNTFVRQP